MKHIPVLLNEVIDNLAPRKNENFIDATLGFGGHAENILEKTAPEGKLLGIDQDMVAIEEASKCLKRFGNRFEANYGNFTKLGLIVRKWEVKTIDGILFDLGVSTYQLTDDQRGFSFNSDAQLDMRMDSNSQKNTAAKIVNEYSQKEITEILFAGEERFAKPIAKKIIQARKNQPIKTTKELVEIIKLSTPPAYRFSRKTHFATGTFRALRMVVNDELNNLKQALNQAEKILSPGGRLAVITFQSLEDRIVKNFFRDNENLEIKTPKPILPQESEIEINPNSRSAKLRVAIKK